MQQQHACSNFKPQKNDTTFKDQTKSQCSQCQSHKDTLVKVQEALKPIQIAATLPTDMYNSAGLVAAGLKAISLLDESIITPKNTTNKPYPKHPQKSKPIEPNSKDGQS